MPTYYIQGLNHRRQTNAVACWYTCLQMVVEYHRELRQTTMADLISPDEDPEMKRRYTANAHPSWAEWRLWSERCGFHMENMCPAAIGVYHLLRRSGPIIYSGVWGGGSGMGHVVVVTGINTDGPTLRVNDPLNAGATDSDMNALFGNLQQSLWENPLMVYDG